MKTKHVQYKESHKLSPNVFLLFFGYVSVIIMLANIAPVSSASYCIFFMLGMAGIGLLFMKAAYTVTVRKNTLEISISFLIRIVLQRLDLSRAKSLEEIPVDGLASAFTIKKSPGGIAYLIKMPTALKVTMPGSRSYIIATADPRSLINLAHALAK